MTPRMMVKAIRVTAASRFSRIEMLRANEAAAAHKVTQFYGASAAQRSLRRAVHVLGQAVDVAGSFDHAWAFKFPVMLLVGASHVDSEVLRLDRAE